MSFLLLNGWRLPALNDSPKQSFEQHGELGVNWLNRPLRNRRALPAQWQTQMAVMLAADADTLEGLLMGEGHHIPCNTDAFSDAGLGPEAGGVYTLPARTPTAGMFGLGYLNVTGTITWNPLLPDTWTVAYWRTVTGTPAHVVVRSDGAKFLNGVRADATITTELTVALGGVALTAGAYDGIVILPFAASDAFLTAFYRFTSGKEVQWCVPFDGFDDEILNRGVLLTAATLPVYTQGQIGKARQFSGLSMARYAGTKTQCFGATELSWEFWINRRSAIVEGTPEAVAYFRSAGATAGSRIFIHTAGANANQLEAFLWTAAGRVRTRLPVGAVTKDAWHHVVVTWTQASGVLTVYLNGVAAGTAVASFPGSAVANDAGVDTVLGNENLGGSPLGGDLDDVRMYRRALSAADVVDHWQAGRHGLQAPVLQPCSSLPALELDGGVVGWRQTTVLGDQGDAPLQQHGGTVGGSSGWKNNSRMPNATLDERAIVEPSGAIPAPQAGITLAERFEVTAALRMTAGGFPNALRTNGLYATGPFDFGRAWLPSGPPAGHMDLSTGIAGAMGGKRVLTVLAWVKRNVTGTQHTVIIHERAAASVKVRLDVTGGNLVRFGGRASVADAAEVLRSSVATLVDTTSWHLVGGIIDLQANRIATVLDLAVNEGVATFAGTPAAFTAENTAVHRIGLDNVGGNRWNGGIAHVWWWFRRLSVGEMTEVYNAGRAGLFR